MTDAQAEGFACTTPEQNAENYAENYARAMATWRKPTPAADARDPASYIAFRPSAEMLWVFNNVGFGRTAGDHPEPEPSA